MKRREFIYSVAATGVAAFIAPSSLLGKEPQSASPPVVPYYYRCVLELPVHGTDLQLKVGDDISFWVDVNEPTGWRIIAMEPDVFTNTTKLTCEAREPA